MFIEQLELPNLFEISHSKQKWKILVKGAVKKANEKEVLGAMEGYKKLKGSMTYTAEGWKCEECLKLNTEDHLRWCTGYKDIRENLNLENDKDLATYLHKIFIKRSDKNTATSEDCSI